MDDDRQGGMSEREFEELLAEALELLAQSEEGEPSARVQVDSFEAVGVLSANCGLVVQIGDAEFQVTIVRSG